MMAPRIDAEGGNFAGLVIMAGSPRNFADILYDQNMAIANTLSGNDKNHAQNNIDSLMALFAGLETMSDDDAKKLTVLGASGYYYKEMNSHPASEYLTALTKPVLILQGDKDTQVYADKDYKEYQTLLNGKENVTFKLYSNLNHLFMPSITGSVYDYKTASHVDNTVLSDISEWILG